MTEVMIHYVSGGEDESWSKMADHPVRSAEFPRVPVAGEVLTGQKIGTVETVVQVAYAKDGSPHLFVVPSPPSPFVAAGLKISHSGVPSLTSFEGNTIGDMIAFLAQYPLDQAVTFNDRQVLVAKAKTDFIVLRLDERDET